MNKSCGTCLENIILNRLGNEAHVGRGNKGMQTREALKHLVLGDNWPLTREIKQISDVLFTDFTESSVPL